MSFVDFFLDLFPLAGVMALVLTGLSILDDV